MDEQCAMSRRDFIVGATAAGIGAVALGSLAPQKAGAAEEIAAPKPEAPKKLKYKDVMDAAREKMSPICHVCPECDGVACAGEVPGMGGLGSGASFRANYDALRAIRFNMRTAHEVAKPDTSFTLWGQKLSMPIISASTGGTTYNMGGKISEEEFIQAVIAGSIAAGTIGMAAEGIGDPLNVYEARLKTVAAHGGKAIAIMKPKTQEDIFKRIRMVEQSGAIAFGIDVDACGRAARALPGQTVEPKDLRKLREIARASRLPFIVKGIMTPDEAEMAGEAGAAAIVVSNHGGRVLDDMPGTAEVLPAIAKKVKGKMIIFVDGGVRYGGDALKLIALGADAVLVGRPVIRGAHGAGVDGVAIVLNQMKNDLATAMVLTGVPSLDKVTRKILA